MTKTCAELFQGMECTIIGNGDEEVAGLAFRSDCAGPHDMFFCIVGNVVDGHSFAQDAIDRGATVLVVERKVYLADATDVTEVVVADSRKAMAHVAANFYDHPSRDFSLVGITGTNGKTTTTYLVEHIANAAGKRCGVIGTVGNKIAGVLERSDHTTPESPDLQQLFARMRDAGCDVVAMEVSSHALDLVRTWGSTFAVTAFTNLTQDHLDYHHTFDDYISIDGAWGRELWRRCSEAGDEVITTGFDTTAQIHPVGVTYEAARTIVDLEVRGRRITVTYPLVGRFNVENVMTAFGCALQLGLSAETIADALATMEPVPGRLERVAAAVEAPISVYVDYAHTPDALTKAIASIKALNDQRTCVVFGCGGNRDATKRPIMGQAALAADYAVVTSDNPRREDPLAIIDDIVGGMDGADNFLVEPDRRRAIAAAIAWAEPGDAVLIAGKGHEDYQIVGTETLSFDDRKVAAEELERAFGLKEQD